MDVDVAYLLNCADIDQALNALQGRAKARFGRLNNNGGGQQIPYSPVRPRPYTTAVAQPSPRVRRFDPDQRQPPQEERPLTSPPFDVEGETLFQRRLPVPSYDGGGGGAGGGGAGGGGGGGAGYGPPPAEQLRLPLDRLRDGGGARGAGPFSDRPTQTQLRHPVEAARAYQYMMNGSAVSALITDRRAPEAPPPAEAAYLRSAAAGDAAAALAAGPEILQGRSPRGRPQLKYPTAAVASNIRGSMLSVAEPATPKSARRLFGAKAHEESVASRLVYNERLPAAAGDAAAAGADGAPSSPRSMHNPAVLLPKMEPVKTGLAQVAELGKKRGVAGHYHSMYATDIDALKMDPRGGLQSKTVAREVGEGRSLMSVIPNITESRIPGKRQLVAPYEAARLAAEYAHLNRPRPPPDTRVTNGVRAQHARKMQAQHRSHAQWNAICGSMR